MLSPRRPLVGLEDCLKLLWLLERRGIPPTNTAVAERLGVSKASVSESFQRLSEAGLITYSPYQAPRLTTRGEREAIRLVRRHRLLETFLVEKLGYSWEEVHDEAHALEHYVSDRFVDRLDSFLGHPKFDPHGAPIPDREGRLPPLRGIPLEQAMPGRRVRVVTVWDDSREVLTRLGEMGVTPGVVMRVLSHAPQGADYAIEVEIAGTSYRLSHSMTEMVVVEEEPQD